MAEQNTGKITQIIGAVLDIKFSQGTVSYTHLDVYKRQRYRKMILSVRLPKRPLVPHRHGRLFTMQTEIKSENLIL